MELVVLFAAVSLLHSYKAQESSGVTPVLLRRGEDLLLNITKADSIKEDDVVLWRFNKSVVLVRFLPKTEPSVSSVYTGRLEFPGKKYSVKVKNLQTADSGVYTAEVIGADVSQTLAGYNVIVQDLVSPVELTVDSVSRSLDSCNFTVTCRTQDSLINRIFRCYNQTCSLEGGEQSEVTTSGSSLQVYLSNGSVICKHSNLVSWTEDNNTMEQICTRQTDLEQNHNSASATLPAVLIPIAFIVIIIIVIAIILYHRKRVKNERDSVENTVYEVPQVRTTAQPQGQSPADNTSDFSPTSTYCLVGPHTGSMGSTETRITPLPESLYAQVEKPAKSLKT